MRMKLSQHFITILAVIMLLTACQFLQPVNSSYQIKQLSVMEVDGVIYYVAHKTIWKKTLLNDSPIRLVDGVDDNHLYLSPDYKWLIYILHNYEYQPELMSLWMINTKRPSTPIQVTREYPFIEFFWSTNNKLWVTEYPEYRIIPEQSKIDYGQPVTYVFNPKTQKKILTPELQPIRKQDCNIYLSPSLRGDRVEACFGSSLLQVFKDNGESTVLTNSYSKGEIAWSQNGERIAFVGDDRNGLRQLFIWERNDNNVRQVTNLQMNDKISFNGLQWSPDNKWIGFHSNNTDLCVLQVQNKKISCFDKYVSAFGLGPVWSPDSNAIIISSNRIGQLVMGDDNLIWDLFIVSIPEGKVIRVTNTPEVESGPVWGK